MACSEPSEDFSSMTLKGTGMDLAPPETAEESCDEEISSSDDDSSSEDDVLQENSASPPELKLRNYQKELAVYANQGLNTIICAPTGSGKTRVAIYIIQEHFKCTDLPRPKVAFLARVVSLADQQYKSLHKYLPSLKIELITGSSSNTMSLHLLIDDYDIFVMTPMILENHLKNKLLPNLAVFSMLVFDECHHTQKGEPYNTLMGSYHITKKQISQAAASGKPQDITLPQIVGLTASIGIKGAEDLEAANSNILKVCANLDVSKMSTINDHKQELMTLVPVPREETRELTERKDGAMVFAVINIMEKLEFFMEEYAKKLHVVKLDEEINKRPAIRKSQKYEQWAVSTDKAAKAVPMNDSDSRKYLRLISITAQYLKEYRFALETFDLVELEDVMGYLEKSFQDLEKDIMRIKEENHFYEYFIDLKKIVESHHHDGNPNLHILKETLMEYLLGDNTRGIIFVRTRALAEALSKWLNRCSNDKLRSFNAHSFTGANVSKQKGGTTQGEQETILNRFRTGEIRLLVATSVAEEGLDIETCNLVIRYNHVGNEISTVQTRGRSRAFNGVSVLLGTKNVLLRENMNRKRAELMMKAIESIRRMPPNDFRDAIEQHQKDIFEKLSATLDKQAAKRKLVHSFQIVCSMCKNVLVCNTEMRTIIEKHRVSIDENLLKKIKITSTPSTKQYDEVYFVGKAICMGEIEPGKRCLKPVGNMIKYKDVHFVAIGIDKVRFKTDNHSELRGFPQWSKVPFPIDEITEDEIRRYAPLMKSREDSELN